MLIIKYIKVYKRLQTFVNESNYFQTVFNFLVLVCLQCRNNSVPIVLTVKH